MHSRKKYNSFCNLKQELLQDELLVHLLYVDYI